MRGKLLAAWLLALGTCACTSARRQAPLEYPTKPAKVDERPVPPADLDARLIAYYPLRGLVLQESGLARVSFTVTVSGQVHVSHVSYATTPEYGIACGHMLEATTWTPARTAGQPVPFSGSFDCRFEHGADPHARTLTAPAAVVPPVQPDYGHGFWEAESDEYESQDKTAVLRITVAQDGRVHVDSAPEGSDRELVRVCTKMLAEGPAWTPAKDERGAPVEYHGEFNCGLDVKGATAGARISLRNVGASGALTPEQVGKLVTEHDVELTLCFKGAVDDVHGSSVGKHWLAFEIQPNGTIGRVEWIERGKLDSSIEPCLRGGLANWRFPPAAARTIVDIELFVDQPQD